MRCHCGYLAQSLSVGAGVQIPISPDGGLLLGGLNSSHSWLIWRLGTMGRDRFRNDGMWKLGQYAWRWAVGSGEPPRSSACVVQSSQNRGGPWEHVSKQWLFMRVPIRAPVKLTPLHQSVAWLIHYGGTYRLHAVGSARCQQPRILQTRKWRLPECESLVTVTVRTRLCWPPWGR